MNLSRKSFLGSVVALFTGAPVLAPKKKLKESFSIEIEEIGSNRFRATLKTKSLIAWKFAEIESIQFTEGMPENAWAPAARLKFLFDINRAIGIHLFPDEKHVWNEWLLDGPYPEINWQHLSPVNMKWPPSTVSDIVLDPNWQQNYNKYIENREWEKKSISERVKHLFTKNS